MGTSGRRSCEDAPEGEVSHRAAPLCGDFGGASLQDVNLGEVQVTPDEQDVVAALAGPGQWDWIAEPLNAGGHHRIRCCAAGHRNLGGRCCLSPRVRQGITRLQDNLLDMAHTAVT